MRRWEWSILPAATKGQQLLAGLNQRMKALEAVFNRGLDVKTVTAAYTAGLADDLVLGDATGGAFSVTLPPAAALRGKRIAVKKIDAGAGAVTVDGNGSETIDGAATYALGSQYDVVEIVSDGSNWQVV